MKGRILILIFVTFAVSLCVLIAFVTTADDTRYNNNFVRILPSHAADFSKALKLSDRSLSFAGITNQGIYINTGDQVISMSADLLDTSRIAPGNSAADGLSVEDARFYIYNGIKGQLRVGNTEEWSVDTVYKSLPGFLAIQSISANSFVLQVVDTTAHKSIFIKSNTPTLRKDLLKKQIDGVICTDGLLQYSLAENILVYTYRYRNQFLCIDTSLNVLRTGKTIDTTSVARIGVYETNGVIRMSKPPFVVNRATAVDGHHLFVSSNLVAKNESPLRMADRSVIDVYNILDGSYRYSFYIFDHEKNKMRSFRVKDSTLFALFPGYVIRYDLAAQYLRN